MLLDKSIRLGNSWIERIKGEEGMALCCVKEQAMDKNARLYARACIISVVLCLVLVLICYLVGRCFSALR